MKVTIEKEIKPKEIYPKLMIYTDDQMILYVYDKHDDGIDGIVLDQGKNKNFIIGERAENMNPDNLVDFHGLVTLENS